MPRTAHTVQALYNGVSQQAAGLRLDSQVAEMVNMWPDVAQGVSRRSPSEHISKPSWNIPDGTASGVFKHYAHKIDKSSDEQYMIHFSTDYLGTGTRIDAVDLEGNELPVIYDTTAAQDYIRSSPSTYGAGGHIRAVSVLDTTFLVNTSVTPAMTSALSQWGLDLTGSQYAWIASGSGTNEYYCRLTTGIDDDTNQDGTPDGVISFDPSISRPEELLEDSIEIPEGTLGSLVAGEWGYGDNDTLGYSTVYVRLTDNVDPDTKADGFVLAKPTSEVAYLTFDDAEKTTVNIDIDGKSAGRYPSSSKAWDFASAAHTLINTNIALGAKATYMSPSGVQARSLRITKETGGVNVPFKITIGDQVNSTLITKKIDKFSDVPSKAYDGDILEVTGEAAESNNASYYIRYEEATSRWVETMPDGVAYELDATTMPHKMTRLRDTTGLVTGTVDQLYFFVEAIDWVDRAVGDDDSNPIPSFIGKPIEDIFFYQDRLGFAAGENVIMSQTKEYFNFFAQTVTDSIDDDPIDVTIGTNSAVTIKWVFPFTNSLELIGTNRQFSLHSGTSNPALTPANVVVDPTTTLKPIPDVRPAELENSLFIVTSNKGKASIFRYQVDPEGINTRAFNITKHVPDYIPDIPVDNSAGVGAPVVAIRASADAQSLFVINTGISSLNSSPTHNISAEVFVYTMLEQGGELVQSAWHRWSLPALSAEVFGSDLFVFCAREENSSGNFNLQHWDTHLEKVSLTKYAHTSAENRYLDDFHPATVTGSGASYEVPWDVPQTVNGADTLLTVVTGDDSFDAYESGYASRVFLGPNYEYTLTTGLSTDETDDWVGFAYESYIELTEAVIKGEEAVKSGSVIHLSTEAHIESGDTVVMRVQSISRDAVLSERTFLTTGSKGQITARNPRVGVHLVAQDAIVTLTTLETVTPLTIQGYTWVVNYTNNSQVT